jgi:hypothetical protein
MLIRLFFTLLISLGLILHIYAGPIQTFHDCSATLHEDTLVIQNSMVEFRFLWNKGNISHYSITEKTTGNSMIVHGNGEGLTFAEAPFENNLSWEANPMEQTIFHPAHLAVTISNQHRGLQVRRIIRIYPETPAITLEHHLKYDTLALSGSIVGAAVDGTESFFHADENAENSFISRLFLPSPHWHTEIVRFFDVTDLNDNLVSKSTLLPYNTPLKETGNLLFTSDNKQQTTLFILKEAPNATSQINFPGFDYSISNRTGITIPFSGFDRISGSPEWIPGYPVTIGIGKDKVDARLALRKYLKNSVNYNADDYEMIMMNTWGDRGRDGRVREDFILNELEMAAALGITHYQIDDGWQQGLSKNSASTEGNLWYAWTVEDWMPHSERFPNGFEPILQKAKEQGLRLGLWFNPTRTNNYATWETDADIIINLYNTYGIQYYKIDGIEIPTRLAEINLNRFFTKIKQETDNNVFFNLDLTAGTRGGYFSFRYTGNLFLENRYTDWGNYYPYRTLRNLWMLSEFFPPEMLQIEFLNKWRNPGKYAADDPFTPHRYNFDYVLATSMAGQPLAWFEASGLPDEANEITNTIKAYREIMNDFHNGFIFPIGNEPSGTSWTGFHSFKKDSDTGYLLIFREDNADAIKEIHVPELITGTYSFTRILGQGIISTTTVEANKLIEFIFPEPNSFVLMKYELLP